MGGKSADKARTEFGNSLARALRSRGMTQVELAESLDTAQSVISAWINGRSEPAPGTVFTLEKQLGMDPGSLSRVLGYLPPEAAKVATTVRDAVARDFSVDEQYKPMLMAVYRELVRLSAQHPGSGRRLRPADQPPGARRRRRPAT